MINVMGQDVFHCPFADVDRYRRIKSLMHKEEENQDLRKISLKLSFLRVLCASVVRYSVIHV